MDLKNIIMEKIAETHNTNDDFYNYHGIVNKSNTHAINEEISVQKNKEVSKSVSFNLLSIDDLTPN